jgi:hypothetical protein
MEASTATIDGRVKLASFSALKSCKARPEDSASRGGIIETLPSVTTTTDEALLGNSTDKDRRERRPTDKRVSRTNVLFSVLMGLISPLGLEMKFWTECPVVLLGMDGGSGKGQTNAVWVCYVTLSRAARCQRENVCMCVCESLCF